MQITVEELKEIERMINAGDEDFNIAISNIKNINLKSVYIKLISKNIDITKRRIFLNSCFEKYNIHDCTFRNIYQEIKKDKELLKLGSLKEYYIETVQKFINEILEQTDIPLKMSEFYPKWPNNAENN